MVGTEHGRITTSRSEGVVLLAKEPLAHLAPASDGQVTIKWSEVLLNKTGIDRQAAVAALEEDRAASNKSIAAKMAATQWCL